MFFYVAVCLALFLFVYFFMLMGSLSPCFEVIKSFTNMKHKIFGIISFFAAVSSLKKSLFKTETERFKKEAETAVESPWESEDFEVNGMKLLHVLFLLV